MTEKGVDFWSYFGQHKIHRLEPSIPEYLNCEKFCQKLKVAVLITWLRTIIDDDLQSLNFLVHPAWRKARDRDVWHQDVSTATLH